MTQEKMNELLAAGRPVHNQDAFSRRHPEMPCSQRAKIFKPFDALDTWDEAIGSETVETVHPSELSEESQAELDRKFAGLLDRFSRLPKKRYQRMDRLQVSILYFERDLVQEMLKNDGERGNYRWICGSVLQISESTRSILLDCAGEAKRLEMKYIYAIEGADESRYSRIVYNAF